MAIAYDNSTHSGSWGAAGPLNFSHTTSGSDRILFVVTTARLDVGFVWNTVTSKWRCIAAA